MHDTLIRLIRTWVPIAVGAVVANAPGLEGAFNADALVAACIAGYYAVAAFLETKVHPSFGWLLGVPK